MVDENHAEGVREPRKEGRKVGDLLGSERSARQERARWQRAREADQCDGPTPAHEGEAARRWLLLGVVAAHAGAPAAPGMLRRGTYIDVVIAGHEGDAIGRAEAIEPRPRRAEFLCER